MTIKDADWGYRILRKMPSAEQATLVEKIILYLQKTPSLRQCESKLSRCSQLEGFLGEYIDESTVEELQMAWKSIGQRMGFVSAGDARRDAEKALLRPDARALRRRPAGDRAEPCGHGAENHPGARI